MGIRNRLSAATFAALSVIAALGLQACNRNEPKSNAAAPPPDNTAAPGSAAGSTPGSMSGNTTPAAPSTSGTASGGGG